MNKYLTATLAALVLSQANATSLDVSTGMTVNGTAKAGSSALLGLTLGVEHFSEVSDHSSVFFGSHFYVPGSALSSGGPTMGDVVVGGSFKDKALPAQMQLGLAAVAITPAESENGITFAPGMVAGVKFNVTNEWQIHTRNMVVFPVNNALEVEAEKVSISASFGVSHSIALEA